MALNILRPFVNERAPSMQHYMYIPPFSLSDIACSPSEMDLSLIDNAISLEPNSTSGLNGALYKVECAPGKLMCFL